MFRRKRKPHSAGHQMCEALGLDPNKVIGFTLEVRLDAVPNLTVIHYAWDGEMEAFARTLTNFTLNETKPNR